MIQNSQELQQMLNNIVNKVILIKDDFVRNRETHCNYILEKLQQAQWDLDILVRKSKEKAREIENENKE